MQVATFVREAIVYLSDREGAMTRPGRPPPPARPPARGPAPEGGRRVSLGTVPDFTFQGPGVRVDSVVEGSPAAAAGIEAGDVLLAVDGDSTKDLRAYQNVLEARSPGDRVKLTLRRGEATIELEATLRAR